MNVYKLLTGLEYEKIWGFLYSNYFNEPDCFSQAEVDNLYERYKAFKDMLLKLTPLDNPDGDTLMVYLVEDTDEPFYDVSLQKSDSDILYAIEAADWDETLGYTVCEESLKSITPEEFAAHYLYEITFFGFDEEKRRKYLQEDFNT